MAPLDALTEARIRALEISLAWVIERLLVNHDAAFDDEEFRKVSMGSTYIIDFAEKIISAFLETDTKENA